MFRKFHFLIVASLILSLSPGVLSAQDLPDEPAGMKSIFNGKDLTGWDGDTRLWSVKDGAIRGETTPEVKANGNTFIIWKAGELKDFDLRLSFRCNATNNSGIQYRSRHITENVRNKWVVRGYQHEIRNQNILPSVSGFIYDEGGLTGGRGRTCMIGELDEWNDVAIICKGNHIQHYMNGRLVLDFTDKVDKALLQGILAFQLHGGSPMWAEFKDIRVMHFKK
jgi:hypothetical protein